MTPSHRQEFCVRWNSHLGSIGAAFPQLLAGQRFVDVTLACEGHQVHCHRLVLAACSSYFESILAENPCKHPVIILPSEIKLWEIQALVDFMYKGEVNVTQAGLPQLLRCAEQLRIRGLYGSDAALNLNQLKAMSGKVNVASSNNNNNNNNMANNTTAESNEDEEDTATNSTTTTTATAASTIQTNAAQQQQQQQLQQQQQQQQQIVIKKEPTSTPSHSSNHSTLSQNLQVLNPANLKTIMRNPLALAAVAASSFAPNDSGDESTSNAYEHYENSQNANTAAPAPPTGHLMSHHMDSTVEEDHNYVAHDEDDSFGGAMADSEHDSTANNSMLQSMDNNCSLRRIRRSEESLEQAAKCVSKGQTFQTVSNMFNIPVSTIRFYMARKGILPKRKRGRGASNTGGTMSGLNMSGAAAAANAAAVMSQALAQIKRADSPSAAQFGEAPYHLMGYKMEPGTAHLV
ncbi:protein abrupt [Lucilia cuprina]|uniref:protein abrupt n=1 Tax=Lucilia cuprina TaxID=7375 RepID=UPI001F054D45|nr:protein abrupt [Lucilia cuprina]XP_046802237.1 protein abrupt [Lucilia cuprina]